MMKHKAILNCATLVFALTACSSDEGMDGGSGSTGGGGAGASGGGAPSVCGQAGSGFSIQAAEASNYTFTSDLMISEVLVAPRTELTFDWSAVDVDFINHELDPKADIDMVAVIIWKLDSRQLAMKLNADDLSQSDFEAIAMIYTENAVTSGRLFDFTEFGAEIDPAILLDYLDPTLFDPATHAYTVMASTGTTPGKDTRMIQAFKLDEGSTETNVVLRPDSATLDYTVDLSKLEPVQVPAGERDVTVDWSRIALNAMGAEFDPTSITEVVVGHYSMTAPELEDRFLDIDMIADELYWGEVQSGSSFSLEETVTQDGAGFPGIDDTGTWLLGLRCGTCTNPAPWYLTILKPCSGGDTSSESDAGQQ